MTNATIDHMVSLTIFVAAILIFIGLFSQTMQTGISYERHKGLSTKTSDLLDTMLLNPGIPAVWGKTDGAIVGFGLQDPDYSQYRLSPFSVMRLTSSTQGSVYYSRTDTYYRNISVGLGSYVLAPVAGAINYSTVSELQGISNNYGFQLTLTPTLTISTIKTSEAPLTFSVDVYGTGYLLANAPLSYSLLVVSQNADESPSFNMFNGVTATDVAGSAQITFPGVDCSSQTFALLVYSYLDGLKGIGSYIQGSPDLTLSVVPLIDSFESRSIILAHSDSVGVSGSPSASQLSYNASFVILTEDYSLRSVELDQSNAVGQLVYDSGSEQDYSSLIVPDNVGILVIAYKGAANQYGLVLMPWGLSSLGGSLTFGGNPEGHDWVTTDIRQVTIGSIAYQAKLELWNLQGNSK
jgi:hypothetical protein